MKVIHRRVLSLCTALALVIPSSAQALENVTDWAQSGVEAANQAGLEPSSLTAADAEGPITRAEFAAVALAAYEAVSGVPVELTDTPVFPDCEDPTVSSAYLLGLVSGRSDGTFAPAATINRQELCVMLSSVASAAGLSAQSGGGLEQFPDADTVDWWAREAVTAMTGLGVMSGVSTYGALRLEPFGTATRQQALILAVRFVDAYSTPPEGAEILTPDPEESAEPSEPVSTVKDNPLTDLTAPTEEEKTALVFGEQITYFADEAEAKAAMETIEVPVWHLKESGEKTASSFQLTVHAKLAPIVKQIFQEIFDGPEQFPIKNVGGYAWRSSEKSEHRWGTAIDINWEENFEADIGEDGELTATAGNYWKPGEDPYSIPADGDVVRIFKKYGFAWGGDAWSSKRDYMHFSYFGR